MWFRKVSVSLHTCIWNSSVASYNLLRKDEVYFIKYINDGVASTSSAANHHSDYAYCAAADCRFTFDCVHVRLSCIAGELRIIIMISIKFTICILYTFFIGLRLQVRGQLYLRKCQQQLAGDRLCSVCRSDQCLAHCSRCSPKEQIRVTYIYMQYTPKMYSYFSRYALLLSYGKTGTIFNNVLRRDGLSYRPTAINKVY